jgi:hypothetical protein
MPEKIDELKHGHRTPNSAESIKIKEEFWKKMSDHLENTKNMIKKWAEEDKQNEIK